jgi:hypothetical protein
LVSLRLVELGTFSLQLACIVIPNVVW